VKLLYYGCKILGYACICKIVRFLYKAKNKWGNTNDTTYSFYPCL
jgi:hypothetical protein